MMQTKEDRRHVAGNVWSARVIPLVLLGIITYATYVTVGPLSVKYLLARHHDSRAVIPILVIHFILLSLMLSSFFRLVHITYFDPPVLPVGPAALQERQLTKERNKKGFDQEGIAGSEYKADGGSGGTSTEGISENENPDSPGLEMFYTKDIFICQLDGKPKFCSECANWKFDRTHHCSMNNRCILKMDHFCPWIGGPLGESNIKYFIQFNGYAALYCTQLVVVMANYLKKQRSEANTNPQIIVILALACLFAFFTGGMFSVSFYGVMRNLTQVESLNAQPNPKIYTLAVLKPKYEEVIRVNPNWNANPSFRYPEITYPLSYPQASNAISSSTRSFVPRSTSEPSEQIPRISGSPQPLTSHTRAHYPAAAAQDENENQKVACGRDQLAKRTFSILQMKAGDNPWDLESTFQNIRTVMGTRIIDWFLPVKRSPCCNHEDPQSQFALGPSVDLVIASLYFKEASDPDLEWEAYPQALRDYLSVLRKRRAEKLAEKHGDTKKQRRQDFDLEEGLQASHRMENLPT